MSPIDPDNFDLDGLDAAADAYEKAQRTSQRREARKLQSLIVRLLIRQPAMSSADVLKELRAKYRGGVLPTSATFVREIGSICREVREGGGRGRDGTRRSKSSVAREPRTDAASKGPKLDPVAVGAKPSPAPAPTAIMEDCVAADARHPLEIYAGTFGGRVYVHGQHIRAFFAAVEKRLDDRTLKALALQIQSDPASHAKLVDLHLKDRSIIEAALTLA